MPPTSSDLAIRNEHKTRPGVPYLSATSYAWDPYAPDRDRDVFSFRHDPVIRDLRVRTGPLALALALGSLGSRIGFRSLSLSTPILVTHDSDLSPPFESGVGTTRPRPSGGVDLGLPF